MSVWVETVPPLLLCGFVTILFSRELKLRHEGKPIYFQGREFIDLSLKVLKTSIFALLVSAGLGFALDQGFSIAYAIPLILGLLLALTGGTLAILGITKGRKVAKA